MADRLEKMKSTVSIARNRNEEQAVREAFDLLGGVEKFISRGHEVLIKPNLSLPKEQPETTSPEVVAALVKICKEYGASKVYVGDQPVWGIRTRDALRVTGIGNAAEKEGGEIVCFEDVPRMILQIPDGHFLKEISIPKILKEVDVIINAPKMKNANMAQVSLGMKNLLGCIPFHDRLEFHRGIDMAYVLADLAKAIRPNLTIIDGIVAMEGNGPHQGTSKRMDLIIASTDIVAADAVATAIMGYHPLFAPSTQVGVWMGLGTADLTQIDVRGQKIEDVKSPFAQPILRFVSPHPNVRVYPGGICPGCQARIPRLPPNPDPNKKYAVVIGRRAPVPKDLNVDEIWCFGLCGIESGAELKSSSNMLIKKIPGCPPIRWFAEQGELKHLKDKGIATDFSAK